MSAVKSIIQHYYDAFNQGEDETLCSLLHTDVIHQINQGCDEVGIEKFHQFLKHMRKCYDEKVYDLVIFADDANKRASAEFFVKGKYIKTDNPLPAATGQPYDLRVGAFFDLKDDKIIRVTTYYNLNEWLKMVYS